MAAQGPEPWRLILFSLPRSRFQICTQGSGRFLSFEAPAPVVGVRARCGSQTSRSGRKLGRHSPKARLSVSPCPNMSFASWGPSDASLLQSVPSAFTSCRLLSGFRGGGVGARGAVG